MSEWEWHKVNNLVRFIVIVSVAIVVGFGVGWFVNGEIHSGDVCDFARENYERVMSQPEDDAYMARLEAHVAARYFIACGESAPDVTN